LSAADFADEVAAFYRLPRIDLPQLLAATPLTAPFSRRFLREMMVFPCTDRNGLKILAIADPSDHASIRAAELVLGGPVAVRVASFEDISTLLLDPRSAEPDSSAGPDLPTYSDDDDIESLR